MASDTVQIDMQQPETSAGSTVDLLWYVSYASNIHTDRFLCYLQGGTPPGATRSNVVCADPSPPRDSRTVHIPHSLYFAGHSILWNGGIAFINPEADGALTKARAYLITWEQFCHIANQENWRHERPLILPSMQEVVSQGYTFPYTGADSKSFYARVVCCGELEGRTMFTLAPPRRHTRVAKPSPAYLRIISDGIQEAYNLTIAEVITYLMAADGVAGNYTHDELLAIAREQYVTA